MREYWNNAAETAQALRADADGDVWLHTGDIGYMDEDGYVFLTDRKKDLIKPGGYQVWPREVEEVLAATRRLPKSAWPACPMRPRAKR